MVVGMTAPILEDIPLSRIKDGGAQMRVEKTSPDIINEYAEAMLKGDGVPAGHPVFRWHRLLAR